MGQVYRARDTASSANVALKLLTPGRAASPDALLRFARAAARGGLALAPGHLSIFDLGEVDGVPFAVMELLRGETLRSALARGPLPGRAPRSWRPGWPRPWPRPTSAASWHRDVKPRTCS